MSTHLIRNQDDFRKGITWIKRNDNALGAVIQTWGPPPMWARRPGFVSLLHIILEQQVSLASALAVMEKLRLLTDRLTPRTFLSLSDKQLRGAGFSRQKARYSRILATAILAKDLDLNKLTEMPAQDARSELQTITGIGPWTAEIYLLMVLRHRDIWPPGDLALRAAMRELFKNELGDIAKTTRNIHEEDELQKHFAERWRPWRSIAARVCWLHYLRTRNR